MLCSYSMVFFKLKKGFKITITIDFYWVALKMKTLVSNYLVFCIILLGDLVRGHWGTLLICRGIGKQTSVSVKISCRATRYVHVPVSMLQPVVSSWWDSVLCLPGVYRKQLGKISQMISLLEKYHGKRKQTGKVGDRCLPEQKQLQNLCMSSEYVNSAISSDTQICEV